MIYTFYGYKGGVGRTLALAHTASLLASTRGSAARVLVIDLDLEAPGSIEILLPPANGQSAPERGFSEMLDEYLAADQGEEWMSEQLNRNMYLASDSLYVLGSGSRERATFLEASRLLPAAYEAGFFPKFKKACDAFEYVLIDARTGLADVATAATILLGDVLVACFRPNLANFGIAEIVRHFLAYNSWKKEDAHAQIVPLMTPRPAYYSLESRYWADQFRDKFFGPHEIIQIPFDPMLQVGERLLAKPNSVRLNSYAGGVGSLAATGTEEIDIDAPVLAAYTALMDRMASYNTQRDIVAALQAETRAYSEKRYMDGLDYLAQIIRREPDVREHWHAILGRYEDFIALTPGLAEKLKNFLDSVLDGPDPIATPSGRAWAYVLRGRLFRFGRPGAEDDCDQALTLAPPADRELIGLARFAKAEALRAHRGEGAATATAPGVLPRLESAYGVILGHIDAAMEALGATSSVLIARGDTLFDLQRYEEALVSYEDAARKANLPSQALLLAGRTLERLGRFGEALQRYRAAAEHSQEPDLLRRLTFLMASLNQFPQAFENVDRWLRATQWLRTDAWEGRIIVSLIAGDIDGTVTAIHQMLNQRLHVRRTFWVALTFHQRRFDEAARFTWEDPNDVKPYLRMLALAAVGTDVPTAVPLTVSDGDGAARILAAVLAGYPTAAAALGQLKRSSNGGASFKSKSILALTDALIAARQGSDQKLRTFIERTTCDPDVAIYLRNQLELRLARLACESPEAKIDPVHIEGLQRVMDAWMTIPTPPLDAYPPFRFLETPAEATELAVTATS